MWGIPLIPLCPGMAPSIPVNVMGNPSQLPEGVKRDTCWNMVDRDRRNCTTGSERRVNLGEGLSLVPFLLCHIVFFPSPSLPVISLALPLHGGGGGCICPLTPL